MNVNVYLNDYICIHIDTDYTDIDTDLSVYYITYIFSLSLSIHTSICSICLGAPQLPSDIQKLTGEGLAYAVVG